MRKEDIESLWTRRDVMEYLSISDGYYHKLLKSGVLKGTKKGNTTIFSKKDVEDYVRSLPER
jgi:excisionase family DNA binding protein